MEKIRISAVSYTNSKPFVYGLENSSIMTKIDLQKDIPTDCAEKLISTQVDIGLVPVATLPLIPNAQIIGDYCIGSNGAVDSVFVLSNKNLKDIKTIQLDAHSRTSNNLARVLFHYYFKQNITYIPANSLVEVEEVDAIVLIGDRTFGKTNQYKTVLDLGYYWKEYTGLPFVFAAWIANKTLSSEFIKEFNQALKLGLEHIPEVIKSMPSPLAIDLNDYFYHKLQFDLDDLKREAINLFLEKIENLPSLSKN